MKVQTLKCIFRCPNEILLGGLLNIILLFPLNLPLHAEAPTKELGWNDEEMIAFFKSHEKQFVELGALALSAKDLERVGRVNADFKPRSFLKDGPQTVAEFRRRMRELQLDGPFSRDFRTETAYFAAKSFGTLVNGATKGFCLAVKRPSNVATDLDLQKPVKKGVIYYRPLKGDWYIYLIEE